MNTDFRRLVERERQGSGAGHFAHMKNSESGFEIGDIKVADWYTQMEQAFKLVGISDWQIKTGFQEKLDAADVQNVAFLSTTLRQIGEKIKAITPEQLAKLSDNDRALKGAIANWVNGWGLQVTLNLSKRKSEIKQIPLKDLK